MDTTPATIVLMTRLTGTTIRFPIKGSCMCDLIRIKLDLIWFFATTFEEDLLDSIFKREKDIISPSHQSGLINHHDHLIRNVSSAVIRICTRIHRIHCQIRIKIIPFHSRTQNHIHRSIITTNTVPKGTIMTQNQTTIFISSNYPMFILQIDLTLILNLTRLSQTTKMTLGILMRRRVNFQKWKINTFLRSLFYS